jgi:hypothetical protein
MDNDKRTEECDQALKKMVEQADKFVANRMLYPESMADDFWTQTKEQILQDIYIQGYSQGRVDEIERSQAKVKDFEFDQIKKEQESKPAPCSPKLTESDLSSEEWREYFMLHDKSVYRIDNPVKLYMRPGGTTHRVLDSKGIVHCVIAPGPACVLRWQNREGFSPCQF